MAYLRLRVTASARRDCIDGWRGDVLRLRVSPPPERGKANDATLRLLAQALGLDRRQLSIVRGVGARDKLVLVQGMEDGELRRRLRASGPTPSRG